MTKRNKSGDLLDVSRMQQLVNHVENQQRLHSIIGKTFPRFGERDVAEPARVSKEGAILGLMHGRRVLWPVRFGKLFAQRQRRQFKTEAWGNAPGCRETRSPSA